MALRTQPTNLLQILSELMLNSKVIFISIIGPDDTRLKKILRHIRGKNANQRHIKTTPFKAFQVFSSMAQQDLLARKKEIKITAIRQCA